MRPTCERCARELPADQPGAMICSFECTFCADCVSGPLNETCPNCGGTFVPRPPRPTALLAKYPPRAPGDAAE
ncbi:DUF1272 domain-containing protein [Amycolatopsis jejuensis]|uniref:DUF1272 domain-containing protein n=1 Tax=Amycolatopsis jejuensis TaxID=330084 RepID=UPI003CCB8776